MPEENQIQTGFQPEIQINSMTQQSNLVQNQQPIQEDIQQNNSGLKQEKLKSHLSWLSKILIGVYFILGFGLIFIGIYDYFGISSSWWYYYSDSIWNIITNNGTWVFFLAGIFFIIIGAIKLFYNKKSHTSLLVKIVSRILCFLGFGLIGLGIYSILGIASDSAISTFTVRDIINYSGIRIFGPLGIGFIALGVLSYRTQNIDIYYHPTRLTKILTGIYRFLGITLIWSGLWNFSLIGTEDLSFLKILYVGGAITLCGILYILLGKLLYNIKSKMHLGFSMLCALIINIMFACILRIFTEDNFSIDNGVGIIVILFTLIYFSISTIRRIIKCRKFNKKGIINPKYLDQTPSKKKIGIITTIILFSLIIINLIYGKIQWSKIPEIDESIFQRSEHQTKLPDEEDALVQLNALNDGNIYDIFNPLDSYFLYEWNSSYYSEGNKDISWKQHIDECIIINSGGNEYCGTWSWSEKTLKRVLNNYYYMGNNYYAKDFIDADGYLSMNGKKATIFEYIDKNKSEIELSLQKLDKILSLDYNLKFPSSRDEPFYLLPQFLQGYTRANMVMLQYYTLNKDWNMVIFLIKLEYKMVDLLNHYGSELPHFISFVIQNTTDSTINGLISVLPNDFRVQLSERYSNLDYNKEWMLTERTKGEYNIIWKNWAKDRIFTDVGSDIPSLTQFLFHFPFLSKKDSNRFMEYAYYNLMYDEDFYFDSVQLILPKRSLYNFYGSYPYQVLRPRLDTYNDRLENSIFHKEAIIKNLKSGKYDVRFSEKDWDSYEYENNRIPTNEELIENKIKEYSNIIEPCFGKNIIDPVPSIGIYPDEFEKMCTETLSQLKEKEDDDIGLKEILIELTQSLIDYSKFEVNVDACWLKEKVINGSICDKIFDEEISIVNKVKEKYKQLSNVLKNIKNDNPSINIDLYFYIPYQKIYNENNLGLVAFFIDEEKAKELLNNIELQETTDTINQNLSKLSTGNKTNEQINYENLVILTNTCIGEDILNSNMDVSYDNFTNQCNYIIGELKNLDNSGDFKQLNKILTLTTKEWMEFANLRKEEDLLFEKDGIILETKYGTAYQNGSSPERDILFDKEDKNLENFKKHYSKLEKITKEIKQEYEFTPEMDFYIPYSVINENTFRFMLRL